MGLFTDLFGHRKLKTVDADFGAIQSFSRRGTDVGWLVNKTFIGFDIDILIAGDKDGISEIQKQVLLHALNNDIAIYAESAKALNEKYQSLDIVFDSLEKHFELKEISVRDEGLEMAFQEKGGAHHFFIVYIENNKSIGVSIDGLE